MLEIVESENIDGDQGICSELQSDASLHGSTNCSGLPKNRTMAKDVAETTASFRDEVEAVVHPKNFIPSSE